MVYNIITLTETVSSFVYFNVSCYLPTLTHVPPYLEPSIKATEAP